MRKMLPVVLLSVGLSFGLAISPLPAMASGVINSLLPSVAKLTVTAPNGANGIAFSNTGARLDLGPGASDYLTSNGTSQIVAAGYLSATFGFIGPVFPPAVSLGTCSVGVEREIAVMTGTGGTNSGSQTRFCACVSDGAASPTYSWRNLISGTAGNATTCNP